MHVLGRVNWWAPKPPGVQDRLPTERAQTRLDLLVDVGRYRRRCCQSGRTVRAQELVMVGAEMPVERSAQLVLLLLYLHRRRLKVRIHGRPRSDRKRRFLLSAVAPSTSTRHPREAKPINWAQRGGLASRPGNCVLTPRPHFTAPSCTLGNQVVGASDGPPFRQERRPTRVCRTLGAGSDLLAEGTLRAG
jgi:hypothetical protein